MNLSEPYLLIALGALLLVAVLIFFIKKGKREERLTTLASLAFAFILVGILFDQNRVIGYGLIAIGIVLAIIDILRKNKTRS